MAEKAEICTMADLILNLGLGSTLGDADAALLETTKRQVEDRIRRFVRWDITTATYTNFLPAISSTPAGGGGGLNKLNNSTAYWSGGDSAGQILQLPAMYVTSITSVNEDRSARGGQGASDFGASTLLTSGTDYYLDMDDETFCKTGHIVKVSGAWSRIQRTIKVVYVAGFTAAQLDEEYRDIKQACILETRKWYKRAKSGQGADGSGVGEVKSESIGGEYTVTYNTSETEKMGSLSGQAVDMLNDYRRWSFA